MSEYTTLTYYGTTTVAGNGDQITCNTLRLRRAVELTRDLLARTDGVTVTQVTVESVPMALQREFPGMSSHDLAQHVQAAALVIEHELEV
jgi:hypothetical protein